MLEGGKLKNILKKQVIRESKKEDGKKREEAQVNNLKGGDSRVQWGFTGEGMKEVKERRNKKKEDQAKNLMGSDSRVQWGFTEKVKKKKEEE